MSVKKIKISWLKWKSKDHLNYHTYPCAGGGSRVYRVFIFFLYSMQISLIPQHTTLNKSVD